ncbi:hypothetical protein GCM10023205_71010 [Yinghuangia aomiensis]|uniref:Uncharacterized protein n=2 Tax=Yinghuangia aomiensis TaxID=676205 RepID=A0ABP9I7D5_9ACTN
MGVMAADLGIGNERVGATAAAVVALTSVVVGVLVSARAAGHITARAGGGTGSDSAVAAVGAGLFAVVLVGLHLADPSAGVETETAGAGAVVATMLGLIDIVLVRLALTRSSGTVRTGLPVLDGAAELFRDDVRTH